MTELNVLRHGLQTGEKFVLLNIVDHIQALDRALEVILQAADLGRTLGVDLDLEINHLLKVLVSLLGRLLEQICHCVAGYVIVGDSPLAIYLGNFFECRDLIISSFFNAGMGQSFIKNYALGFVRVLENLDSLSVNLVNLYLIAVRNHILQFHNSSILSPESFPLGMKSDPFFVVFIIALM